MILSQRGLKKKPENRFCSEDPITGGTDDIMVAAVIVYLGRELPTAAGLEGSREGWEVLCYAVGRGYHPVNTNIEIRQAVTCR